MLSHWPSVKLMSTANSSPNLQGALLTGSVTASADLISSRSMAGMRCTGHAGFEMEVPGVFQNGAPPRETCAKEEGESAKKRQALSEQRTLFMMSIYLQVGERRSYASFGCKVAQSGQLATAPSIAKSSSLNLAASIKASSLAARSISLRVRAMSFSMALRSLAFT